MNQTCENGKKKFRAWYWPLWPKSGPKKFFSWILPLLDVRQCYKLSLSAISRNTNKPNCRKWKKSLVPGRQFFFSKIWLRQSLDIMVSYHLVQYQEKLMIQSWENLVTDGRMHRRTEGWEWIHRTLTNVEGSKDKFKSFDQNTCEFVAYNVVLIKLAVQTFCSNCVELFKLFSYLWIER